MFVLLAKANTSKKSHEIHKHIIVRWLYVPRFVFSSTTHINQKNARDTINDDVNAVAWIALAAPPSPTTGAAVDGGGLGSVLQHTLSFPSPWGQQNFPRPRS